jgi:hypothetical protein
MASKKKTHPERELGIDPDEESPVEAPPPRRWLPRRGTRAIQLKCETDRPRDSKQG